MMNPENDPKEAWKQFSGGWRKWDEVMMNFTRPISDEMIHRLNPAGNEVILDIASGTGEPALTIASMLKLGKVLATDLTEEMLSVTFEKASARSLKNLETKICDASALPFTDHSFDGVTCRLGLMLFSDMQQSLSEMIRVVRPGGKIVVAVWGTPKKNFWVTAMMGNIRERMQLPMPSPDSPETFRAGTNGLVRDLFQKNGLKKVTQTEVSGKLECPSPEFYWELMSEAGASIAAALSKADELVKAQIKEEVIRKITNRFPHEVAIDSSAFVISGEK